MSAVMVRLSQEEYALAVAKGRTACIGGRSNIVQDKQERDAALMDHQVTAMAGQIALSKYWAGSTEPFLVQRFFADLHKFSGDGGSDLPGTNVDIKTSRKTAGDLWGYHLWVRAREYKPGTIYILGVFEPEALAVYLLGWCLGAALTQDAPGRWGAVAQDLHPLPPAEWRW